VYFAWEKNEREQPNTDKLAIVFEGKKGASYQTKELKIYIDETEAPPNAEEREKKKGSG
jgi:hypothetical protein